LSDGDIVRFCTEKEWIDSGLGDSKKWVKSSFRILNALKERGVYIKKIDLTSIRMKVEVYKSGDGRSMYKMYFIKEGEEDLDLMIEMLCSSDRNARNYPENGYLDRFFEIIGQCVLGSERFGHKLEIRRM
jgi:hypothetical protein